MKNIEVGAYRIRHLALQVEDLERSISFYVNGLGMKLLRRRATAERNEIAAYLGYGDEATEVAIELFQFLDNEKSSHLSHPSHVAIAVNGIEDVIKILMQHGAQIKSAPTHHRAGSPSKFAFVLDPDGHEIELTQAG